MTTLLAGFIGGIFMGMIFVTHAALVMVFRPPAGLHARTAESPVSSRLAVLSVASLFTWSIAGVGAAALYDAMSGDTTSGFAGSISYMAVVLFIAAMTAIPAALFLRDRLKDLAIEYALFVGLFAFLIPALVRAMPVD